MISRETTASHIQVLAPLPRHEVHEFARVWRSLSRAKLPLVGLAVLAITLVLALGAPFLLPYESNEVNIVVRLRPPALLGGTWEYPLGTDEVGRDVLTRLIYGARISLAVGFGAAAFAGTVGLVLGLLSGYFVGLLDEVIMRVADILLGFPFLLLAMLTVMMLGPGVGNMILVLGAFGWVGFARVVRAETLSVREKEFVEAARAVGCGDVRIIVFHILANVFHSMIILVTFSIATVMVVEAALSFLGLGVPPAIPSWGKMLSDSRNVMGTAPWMSILPGLCLTIVVLSLNLVGDWLRDYLDPRLRI
jgi:peptide/nickel transport system permease protein